MSERLAACAVFAVVFGVYVTTTGGSYATDLASYEVTKNLSRHGSFAMTYNVLATEAERGLDGQYYAPVGVAHPLFGIPFYLASRAVQSLVPLNVGKPESLDKAAVVTGSAVAPALCAPAAFLFAIALGQTTVGALVAAFGLAFGTTLWPYSKFGFNAPLATMFLLWATYWTWRGGRSARNRQLVLGGALLAGALLTRHEMAVMAAPLGVWLLYEHRDTPRLACRRLAFLATPVTVGVGLWMWYNVARFGHPFDTGLMRDPNVAFDTPLVTGLAGLLASPGRSLFLYAPLTIVGVAALPVLARRDRSTAFLFGGMTLIQLLVIARMHQWDGGESYGPRYLIPILPYLVIPVASLIPLASRHLAWPLATALVASVAVQVPGVLLDYSKIQNEYARQTPGYSIAMSRHTWAAAPLPLNTKAALRAVPENVRYLTGRAPLPPVDRTGVEAERDFSQQFAFSLDFWWLYLFYLGAVPAVGAVVLGLLPLVGAAGAARWLCRMRLEPASQVP